ARDDRAPRADLRLRAGSRLRALQRGRRPAHLRGRRRALPRRVGAAPARRLQLLSGTAYDGIGAPVAPRSFIGKPRKANSYCFSAAISSISTTSMICAPAVENM